MLRSTVADTNVFIDVGGEGMFSFNIPPFSRMTRARVKIERTLNAVDICFRAMG